MDSSSTSSSNPTPSENTAFFIDTLITAQVGEIQGPIYEPISVRDGVKASDLSLKFIHDGATKKGVGKLSETDFVYPDDELHNIETLLPAPEHISKNLIYIVVEQPPEKVALMRESKRKKWAVNSTILPRERPLVYFVDPADLSKNLDLITNIKEGKYVLMHGARASGKSTRTWRVMEELQGSGYFCL
ncbi:hypothetical protein BGX21_000381, partial [Mortierella sp. AD011]